MDRPLAYLSGSGWQTDYVLPLLWYSLIVSVLVCAIIAYLVLAGVLRRRQPEGAADIAGVAITREGNGVRWIWIGCAISLVPLLISLVWTVAVLAAVGPFPAPAPLTIDVTARQWWWDAAYSGALPSDRFTTANEIHVPVGQRVLLRLHSADVIHSFWVPKLAGKVDVIPGQTNLAWIQANRPGRYRGQCAEFCGFQHAHMAFEVVAEPRAQFERWRSLQLQPAPQPRTALQEKGRALVEYRCGLCHTVRGTQAMANAAPDLTHLMSRQTIAAGTLPNNPGALSGWIENPQGSKPGALMPNQALAGPDLVAIRAYLETLQ